MKWASAIATTSRLEDAAAEAAEALAADLGDDGADLIVVFAAREYRDHFARLPDCVTERFARATLLGCSAGGVIGGGREVEHEPALALVGASMPGVKVAPFRLGSEQDEWGEQLGDAGSGDANLILLPDPFTGNVARLLRWLDDTCPGATKIGGLASGSEQPGESVLFLGDRLHRTGTVGVALSGDLVVETIVAQGCRPVGSPMFVTRCDRHVLYELDGRPAIEVLESVFSELPAGDQELLRSSLFLGLVMRDQQEVYEQGDFLIRNLVGVDPAAGALAVAADLRPSQVVQFHLRDADTSAGDLAHLLSRRSAPAPAGALLFSCLGRGRSLYGEADHDSRLFHRKVGQVPLGGFFCSGEIGPVGGRTFLHGYTSSLGLFSPRPAGSTS